MHKQISISDDLYKKFQAALVLTGEDEMSVLSRLISGYAHTVFEGVLGRESMSTRHTETKDTKITETEQKQQFVNWFRTLTRNGRPYNPVTISGYTGRIENACSDPTFASVSVSNLFSITDLAEYISIQKQIKDCPGYAEFDAKSHNGFTAALRKYEEFLRFQSSGTCLNALLPVTRSYQPSSNTHRWTMEEDFICCKRFLEFYVIQKSEMDIVSFLKMLAKEVPDVTEGSLRMKIQNIKYLSTREGFVDSLPLSWLSQYSMQCEQAFKQATKELNLV